MMPPRISHHVFAGDRTTAYSDAVFAIIATIMVLPLKISESDLEDSEESFNLYNHMKNFDEFLIDVILYVVAFYLVMDAWFSHCRIFRLLEYVDDTITCLNLMTLLFISFLPASTGLVKAFQGYNFVLTIACVNIILINLGMCSMVFFAVPQRQIINPLIMENLGTNTIKLVMCIPLLINPILAVFVIVIAWSLDVGDIGLGAFISILPLNLLTRLLVRWIEAYWLKKKVSNSEHEVLSLVTNVVTKERILAFSDGVFSIIGTLIILDFSAVDVHDERNYEEGDMEFLSREKYVLLSYLSSFIIAGLLWFIHHSMFNLIVAVNTWITVFNGLSLLVLGLIPFGTNVVAIFLDEEDTENKIVAVKTMLVILVLSSLTQLALWTVAHCQKSKCLSSAVENPVIEFIQLWKLLIFPFVGVLIYFMSFSSNVLLHHSYTFATYSVPVLFVLPRVLIYIIRRVRSFFSAASSSIVSDTRYSGIQIQDEESTDLLYHSNEKGYLGTETFKASMAPSVTVSGETLKGSQIV